jgi:hypothetical protein
VPWTVVTTGRFLEWTRSFPCVTHRHCVLTLRSDARIAGCASFLSRLKAGETFSIPLVLRLMKFFGMGAPGERLGFTASRFLDWARPFLPKNKTAF